MLQDNVGAISRHGVWGLQGTFGRSVHGKKYLSSSLCQVLCGWHGKKDRPLVSQPPSGADEKKA